MSDNDSNKMGNASRSEGNSESDSSVPSPTKRRSRRLQGPTSELRFLTFNVRVDSVLDHQDRWCNRKSDVARIIHEQNADVIGIQGTLQRQVLDLFSLLDEMSPGRYLWFGLGPCYNENTGEYSGEYNPIFYDSSKVSLQDQGVFWYSLEPSEKGSKSWDAVQPTICTWCKFSCKSNEGRKEDFYVFNTHWDQGIETRRNSSYLLREYLQQFTVSYHNSTNVMTQGTCVVMGDFNCNHHANCFKVLTKGIDNIFANACDISGGDELNTDSGDSSDSDMDENIQLINCASGIMNNQTTYPGFGKVDDTEQEKCCGGPVDVQYGTFVDYILCSPDVSTKNIQVLSEVRCENGRRPSTHYPVVADLSL
ncbi:hypothetical protein AKO1_005752 [Acrasis kona]|uniref:Endonuclease/exonuclease/phosphatase domain-containing protein n=1 Tax=Acrasis kona TaxID=1008807 RepID=A0AAW2YL34_9EUKA